MQVGSRAHSFFSLPSGAWQRARWAWLITQLMVRICCFSFRRHGCLPFGELEYIAPRSTHASKTMRQRGNVEVATDQHDPFWTVLLALDVLLTVRRNDGHHRSFQPTS